MSTEQLDRFMEEAHLPAFRSKQILSWAYVKGVSSYDEMSNIPKAMREQLARELPLTFPEVLRDQQSQDGSRKYLLEFSDGARAETVALPSSDGRLTACISSQAGCAMGCVFCATGKAGLTRNLGPGEFVDQISVIQRDFEERVCNIVVMGQGEPFANYENTLSALRIINNPKLLNIGSRHITVSTCGVLKGIRQFGMEPEQFTLAISLHAARQEVRDSLMPGMKNQRLDSLHDELKRYYANSNRRFSFEYALMRGRNDSEEDLKALIDYCNGLHCHINLIPLNSIEGSPIQPVSKNKLMEWEKSIENAKIPVSIRRSRGSDIAAACGQLASQYR